MIKIIVDGYGGDDSPEDVVEGAVLATIKEPDLHVVLTGKKNDLLKLLEEEKYDPTRFTVIDAPEVIEVDASPTVEFRNKPNSSLAVAFDLLRKQNDILGLVSAGSTGAVLTGGFLKLGRISGVSRPALCPILPTRKNKAVLLCDSGANVDCKPENIAHFAVMANEYSKLLFNIENPKIGLLNIGEEEEKGNDLAKNTYQLLSKMNGINFVGNAEGSDLMKGEFDVIVADGFAGNIALKTAEGTLKFLNGELKRTIKQSWWAKIGYTLFMKWSFKRFKNKINNYAERGAVLLGCKKLVVKAHGNSEEETFCNVILQTYQIAKGNLCEKIAEKIGQYDFSQIAE